MIILYPRRPILFIFRFTLFKIFFTYFNCIIICQFFNIHDIPPKELLTCHFLLYFIFKYKWLLAAFNLKLLLLKLLLPYGKCLWCDYCECSKFRHQWYIRCIFWASFDVVIIDFLIVLALNVEPFLKNRKY